MTETMEECHLDWFKQAVKSGRRWVRSRYSATGEPSWYTVPFYVEDQVLWLGRVGLKRPATTRSTSIQSKQTSQLTRAIRVLKLLDQTELRALYKELNDDNG